MVVRIRGNVKKKKKKKKKKDIFKVLFSCKLICFNEKIKITYLFSI